MKDIFIKVTLFLVGIFAITWLIQGGITLYEKIPGFNKYTSFEGVNLGDSKDQVFYLFGSPSVVYFTQIDDVLNAEGKVLQHNVTIYSPAKEADIQANPRGIKGFNSWGIYHEGKTLFIEFNPSTEKVTSIRCYPPKGTRGACSLDLEPFISRCCTFLQTGDDEATVIRAFGKPDNELFSGRRKTMQYKRYNLEIDLEAQSTISIKVTNFTPISAVISK